VGPGGDGVHFPAQLQRAGCRHEIAADALDTMVIWLQRLHDVDKPTALALASPVVDLWITQVANETWGVHAALPHGAIR
jgi:acetamidase/formamidase